MRETPLSFGPFHIDLEDRRLMRSGETIDLPARYMDVLILLVRAEGALVTKTRFMDEVWRGIPVTDEALTQAIRTLRKALGDSAQSPRFIETEPKHGYRFIAPLGRSANPAALPPHEEPPVRRAVAHLTAAGIRGGVLAGALVGLAYGFADATHASQGGTVSLLLVIILVSALSAGVAGAGIAAGTALSATVRSPHGRWRIAGAALGGLVLGAIANMIGRDAFRLLIGQQVGAFTGALEGLVVGAATGLSLCVLRWRIRYATALVAAIGALSGVLVVLLGGQMMAGSLQTLVAAFPGSQFRLHDVAALLGETGFGRQSRIVTAAFEGCLFVVSLATALHRAEPRKERSPPFLEG